MAAPESAPKQEAAPEAKPAPKTEAKGVEKVNVNGTQVKKQPVEEWNGSVSKSWTPPQTKKKQKANNLTGRKLTKRQKLIIPEPGEYEAAAVPEAGETPEEPAASEDAVPQDTTATVQPEETPLWIFQPKEKVKATLILPLRASTENVSRNNMDFYSGVLLAVKDLGESGIKTELNVYDSFDSSHPIAGEDI